jgi:hypothetical protein
MAELLVLGSPLFWGILLVWLAALFVTVEYEKGIFAFLSTVAYGVLLQFVFHVDVVHIVLHNPMWIIAGMAVYFPIGAAWSFFRWYMFVHAELSKYVDFKTKWLISKGQTSFEDIPDNLKEEWIKYLEGQEGSSYSGYIDRKDLVKPPLVREHKDKILRWIGYWPISAIAWAFNDMIRGFCKMIYGRIANWLQSISNKVFEKVKKDLPDEFKYN